MSYPCIYLHQQGTTFNWISCLYLYLDWQSEPIPSSAACTSTWTDSLYLYLVQLHVPLPGLAVCTNTWFSCLYLYLDWQSAPIPNSAAAFAYTWTGSLYLDQSVPLHGPSNQLHRLLCLNMTRYFEAPPLIWKYKRFFPHGIFLRRSKSAEFSYLEAATGSVLKRHTVLRWSEPIRWTAYGDLFRITYIRFLIFLH